MSPYTDSGEATVYRLITTLKYGLCVSLLKTASFFIALMSWENACRVGKQLGYVWFKFIRIRKTTVLENLETVFPGQKEMHQKTAKCSFKAMGANILELFKMNSVSAEELVSRVTVKGWENYELARSFGKGIIVVTGHFGNFDLLACSQAASGVPLGIVSRELHSRGPNSVWMNARLRFGLTIFKSRQTKKILKWLKSKKVLGLVTDQRMSERDGGVRVPFFKRDVLTSSAPARLALHTGAQILPVYSRRLKNGQHEVVIEKPLRTRTKDGEQLDNFTILVQINQKLENWILLHPCNWMWLHKRFKNSAKSI